MRPGTRRLSGGEKQRLTVARVLLHRPDIIVLDEATAALDPKSQDELMKLLSDAMEGLTIISVGHRPELEQFHSRKLVLERRSGGAKLVSDIELLRAPETGKHDPALAAAVACRASGDGELRRVLIEPRRDALLDVFGRHHAGESRD